MLLLGIYLCWQRFAYPETLLVRQKILDRMTQPAIYRRNNGCKAMTQIFIWYIVEISILDNQPKPIFSCRTTYGWRGHIEAPRTWAIFIPSSRSYCPCCHNIHRHPKQTLQERGHGCAKRRAEVKQEFSKYWFGFPLMNVILASKNICFRCRTFL